MLDTPADAAAHNQATATSFRTRSLTGGMRQACSMLSVIWRAMLATVTPGLRMLDTPMDAAAHNQATATYFGTRISLMTCAKPAPSFLCSRAEF